MVSLDGRSTSVKGLEQQRSNISYQMSAEDRERQAYKEALQNKEERAKSKRALARGLKTKELLTRRFKAWEAEYRKRGCI